MSRGEISVCDGCGIKSPDERGMYIANKWFDLDAEWSGRFGRKNKQMLLCQNCMNACLTGIINRNTLLRQLEVETAIDV